MYETHKSWYSWVLGSLVGAVYTFGFILMCPQLYLNYKLKSVAHLPWRQMSYKFLNTIIDDLFAFVIKMPTLHRLSVFRDDIVFMVFLYQVRGRGERGAWLWAQGRGLHTSNAPRQALAARRRWVAATHSRRRMLGGAGCRPLLLCGPAGQPACGQERRLTPLPPSPRACLAAPLPHPQRWIYRVDKTRVNEFGFSAEMQEQREREKAEAAAAAAAAGGSGAGEAAAEGEAEGAARRRKPAAANGAAAAAAVVAGGGDGGGEDESRKDK
jgi:hypothetical protein